MFYSYLHFSLSLVLFIQIIFFFTLSEAVAQRGSVKEAFLEISQNSQENIFVGVSF